MDPKHRVVVRLPLEEIWDNDGPVESHKLRDLSRNEITDLLRAGSVRFVVANPGEPLNWVGAPECFDFWKTEVSRRLFDPREESFDMDRMPGGYGYVASEWSAVAGERVVLLEMAH